MRPYESLRRGFYIEGGRVGGKGEVRKEYVSISDKVTCFEEGCEERNAYWSFQPWSSTPATLCIHSSTSRFS